MWLPRHGMRVQLTLTGPGPAWAMYDRHLGVFGPKAAVLESRDAAVRQFLDRRSDGPIRIV